MTPGGGATLHAVEMPPMPRVTVQDTTHVPEVVMQSNQVVHI